MMQRYGADAALNQLLESRVEIEKAVGEPLIWNPNPEASDKVIVLHRKADIRIKDQWPELLNWMVDAVVRLRKVFGPRIKILQFDSLSQCPEVLESEENS